MYHVGVDKMAMWSGLAVFICVLTCVPHSVAAGTQCLSNSGTPVDWFIAYKVPANVKSLQNNSFFYMDATNTSWTQSLKTIDQPEQAIYYTLEQIYKHSVCKNTHCLDSDLFYIMYNDQENYTRWRSDSSGHTKGVVAFDRDNGFWLIHSTPYFPPPKATGYEWPSSGKTNGQIFLCISMKTEEYFDVVGKQLLYNYPNIYDKATSAYFDMNFPNMAAVFNRKHVTKAPWFSKAELMSLNGTYFLSFAKFSKFQKDQDKNRIQLTENPSRGKGDLYADWLSAYLEDRLFVESWQKGSGILCTNCSIKYYVYDIGSIKFRPDVVFHETSDNAKWAITGYKPWTCIGDIDRMMSQENRAGGTVCMKNREVENSFYNIVEYMYACGGCP